MNARELLLEEFKRSDRLLISGASIAQHRECLQEIIIDFLEAAEERKREALSRLVATTALLPHAKGSEIGSLGDLLNTMEMFTPYDYTANRKHLIHSVNTCLLGAALYQRVDRLRDLLDEEMARTATLLSGGSANGEFLFRWKLASLSHDIGNGLALHGNDKKLIRKYLIYVQACTNQIWRGDMHSSTDSLLDLARGKNSLKLIDQVDGAKRFSAFFKELKDSPFKGIFYDHGLISALVLLKILDTQYDRMNEASIDMSSFYVSFARPFFDDSIVRAAHAVALHNVDFYPHILKEVWKGSKPYNAEQYPLAFLLKLCDSLQEWQKAKATDETDFIPPEAIELRLTPQYVEILGHPEKDELKTKLSELFETTDLVKIA